MLKSSRYCRRRARRTIRYSYCAVGWPLVPGHQSVIGYASSIRNVLEGAMLAALDCRSSSSYTLRHRECGRVESSIGRCRIVDVTTESGAAEASPHSISA